MAQVQTVAMKTTNKESKWAMVMMWENAHAVNLLCSTISDLWTNRQTG
jgi:hypothetical protein